MSSHSGDGRLACKLLYPSFDQFHAPCADAADAVKPRPTKAGHVIDVYTVNRRRHAAHRTSPLSTAPSLRWSQRHFSWHHADKKPFASILQQGDDLSNREVGPTSNHPFLASPDDFCSEYRRSPLTHITAETGVRALQVFPVFFNVQHTHLISMQ